MPAYQRGRPDATAPARADATGCGFEDAPPLVASCRFQGTAAAVTVHGTGPGVVLEHAPFHHQQGAARVVLVGAKLRAHEALGEVVIVAPKRVVPLGMAGPGVAFEAAYRTGQRVEITVAYPEQATSTGPVQRTDGTVPDSNKTVCPNPPQQPGSVCDVHWKDHRRQVMLERAPDAPPATLVELGGGNVKLSKVELDQVVGTLKCGDSVPEQFDTDELAWPPNAPSRLEICLPAGAADRLHVVVESSARPQVLTEASALPALFGAFGALAALVLAIALAAVWRRRKRAFTGGASASVPHPGSDASQGSADGPAASDVPSAALSPNPDSDASQGARAARRPLRSHRRRSLRAWQRRCEPIRISYQSSYTSGWWQRCTTAMQ